MATTTQPKGAAPKGKDNKGGGSGPLKPTDVIPVWLDAATAKTLLLALSLSLGKSTNGKKKQGKGGKGGKGAGGETVARTAARTNRGADHS